MTDEAFHSDDAERSTTLVDADHRIEAGLHRFDDRLVRRAKRRATSSASNSEASSTVFGTD
jgi:hypothetical protein